MSPEATYWITHLHLQPHPEGGFFREVYRSEEVLLPAGLPERYHHSRPLATSIYFLLTGKHFSALHRLQSDEIWHFYAGDRLQISMIDAGGHLRTIQLGNNPVQGEQLQAVVPRHHWFGAHVINPNGYALVGCTVAPGFDFADFELGERDHLLRQFPHHKTLIEQLTR
ncbi:MAG: cupin domain-containing protein [Gemmatimonadetes bacterium]|nr:MAG: cupin domain-containing protein [Gemmatimonadota bacterium]